MDFFPSKEGRAGKLSHLRRKIKGAKAYHCFRPFCEMDPVVYGRSTVFGRVCPHFRAMLSCTAQVFRTGSASSRSWSAAFQADRLSRMDGSSYDFLRHMGQEQWIFPLASRPATPPVHARTNSSPPIRRRRFALRRMVRLRCLR